MTSLKIAIYQYAARPETPAARVGRLAGIAADLRGTDLVICPELFTSGYNIGPAVKELAEPRDGPTLARLAAVARDSGIAVLAGYPERAGEAVYNSAICVGPDGGLLANHRKLHLPSAFEKENFLTGDALTLFDLKGIRLAILICYDAEFPEAARAAARAGAQAILVPTALRERYRHVSRAVMPTRAFENGCFLAYANYAGEEGDWRYCGESCIVGPDGHDLARAGSEEAVIEATLDMAEIARARETIPYLEDARGDLG